MPKHPGNPARMAEDFVSAAQIRNWERQAQLGMICWFCTAEAVATLIQVSMEPIYRNGAWTREMIRRPVCGPGYCSYGYGP